VIPFSPFPGVVGGFVGRDQFRLKDIGLKPDDFIQLKQVHSDRVVLVLHTPDRHEIRKTEGDALLTDLPGIGIAVRTADCVPILLAHPQGVIGVVHSGWRGTKERILEKALLKMRENWKLDLSDVFVSIGPSICGDCYEVGGEVAEHFMDGGASIARKVGETKFLLDLKNANLKLLRNLCIPTSRIEVRSECTLCHEASFFSYRGELKRKEKGEGRNVSWVMRVPFF
jgi:YfiH family protein